MADGTHEPPSIMITAAAPDRHTRKAQECVFEAGKRREIAGFHSNRAKLSLPCWKKTGPNMKDIRGGVGHTRVVAAEKFHSRGDAGAGQRVSQRAIRAACEGYAARSPSRDRLNRNYWLCRV